MKHNQAIKFESLRPILTWTVGCAAVFLLFAWSPAGRQLELEVFRKIDFWVRESLDRAPTVDRRIRVLALDDQTAGLFQKFDFRIRDWVKIFSFIAEKRPASIFIDKIWSMPIGENFDLPLDQAQADEFVQAMSKLNVPVTVGGSIFDRPIFRRQVVDMARSDYDLKTYLGADPSTLPMAAPGPWHTMVSGLFFGPQKLIERAFTHIGQLDYPGPGQVFGLVRTSAEHVVPHAALLATGLPITVENGRLRVGASQVPTDRDGHILVNLSKPSVYNGALTKSLAGFISKANRGALTDEILPGDFVVILPAMFTGNVDWANTPVGQLQGGFVPVALINSALTGQWLQPIEGEWLWILLACVVAGLSASLLPTVMQIPVLLLMTIGISGAGLLGFAMYGWVIPWGSPAVAMMVTGAVCFFERARLGERQSRRLREALEGTVPPDRLSELLRPGALLKDPSEQVVTIMFIDMVGFSLMAERLTPKVAFDDLKHHLGLITQIIHRHGGVIDKFLGDGVLCFFGYSFAKGSQLNGHPEAAVRCAIEIQRTWQALTMESSRQAQPIYPLRIGINTAAAYIGDVGRGHVHFTMIGQGVNFASRLEGVCEPYKIMLGDATADALPPDLAASGALQKRFVQIKHHDELFLAYEIDPFVEDPELLANALAVYRKSVALERRNARYPVSSGELWMDIGIVNAQVVNFSRGGFAVESSVYLAAGVRSQANLYCHSEILDRVLADSTLMPLIVEVRWGSTAESGQKYRLGFEIKSLNDQQLDRLHDILRQHLFRPAIRRVA